MGTVRIALIGHVEHITQGKVPALPGPGDIAHLAELQIFPGGGGGVAAYQMAKGDTEVHLFSAVGNDDAARFVEAELLRSGMKVHLARRDQPHTRDVVLVTPDAERTIMVVGEPLHPLASDPLPWDVLESCEAVYFTAQDPAALVLARKAKRVVVTARRKQALERSGIVADVVVGSANDPREKSRREDYAHPPHALVMTQGGDGGYVETANGTERFAAAPAPSVRGSAYGAGDSFAGALTAYLALGHPVREACAKAAFHGAAILGGWNPLQSQLPIVR